MGLKLGIFWLLTVVVKLQVLPLSILCVWDSLWVDEKNAFVTLGIIDLTPCASRTKLFAINR